MKNQIPIDQQKGMFARCKKCNGYGYYMKFQKPYSWQPGHRIKFDCTACNGTGQLDWVERITRQ